MALICDLESDGFLENCTKVHCLVVKDTKTGVVRSFVEAEMEEGLRLLSSGDWIVFHNGVRFDLPLLKKLYPHFEYDESKVMDTLVCSRLIYSNVGDLDATFIQQGRLPSKLWGSHSLKAWGYRLGLLKGEYGEKENAWDVFTPEMLSYCQNDVEVTHKLYDKIVDKGYSNKALELEHKVAFICAKMERSGWPFDVKGAASLYAELAQKRDAILKTMQETFEPIVEKRVSEKTGKPLKDKVTEFNPSSRKQIADRLISKYGWKPKEFTPNGQPKIDETVLKALDYPEAQTLAEYFLLEKRVGQLAEGDNAWLKLERKGLLHGAYNPNGAVTGRATHQTPNLAQVPAVRSPYGHECRKLFGVRPGFTLVGCDLSGLELRCLAHFMSKWDDGVYGETVINGKQSDGTDIHTVNQRAAGLSTRDQAKTFIYAFLYGAGDEKIGSIVGGGSKEGKRLKASFLAATPSLAKLREAVGAASKRGFLIGLDGRHLHVRSEHAALNTLLQSAGALISKQWLVELVKDAEARGWTWNEEWTGDYSMCGWVHDEVQIAVKDEYAEEFGKMVVEAARKAGDFFGFKVPIGAEYCTGRDWAETH